MKNKPIRVLYLFSGRRQWTYSQIKQGKLPTSNGFSGMFELPRFGIEADYDELANHFSPRVENFLRSRLHIYFNHLPIFWKIFSYDIVFTSQAYGSQLIRALLPVRRPLWVMQDFSIIGMLGKSRSLKERIFRFLVNRCAGIVTIGKEEAELLKARFPHLRDRIVFIPHGIDLRFFVPKIAVGSSTGGASEKRQIFVPGFDHDRDWNTVFAACEGVCEKSTLPLIATTQPDRLKDFPLPSFATITVFDFDQFVRELDASAVIIIPLDISGGINDAMGCHTLYQAMAMGKAIVATRTPTMESYIVDGENGLLVPTKDPAAMHAAIQRLLSDTELRARLGKNARAYALANLDIIKQTEKLADFFKSLF